MRTKPRNLSRSQSARRETAPAVAPLSVAGWLLLLLAALAQAGVIVTADGPRAGAVELNKGQLTLDGKPVAWEQVLSAVVRGNARTMPPPHAVHMKNGEIWRGQVLTLSGKKLTLELSGRHEVDVDRVAQIELLPLPARAPLAANTLYRLKEDAARVTRQSLGFLAVAGEDALPGALLWIDERQLAVDSPLGVLTLARQGVVRYVIEPQVEGVPLPAGQDEVCLVDGSVLRGASAPTASGLDMTHELLGKLSLPALAVRSLRRNPGNVAWLADLKRTVKSMPLVAVGEPQGGPVQADADGSAASVLRFEAGSTSRFKLPAGAASLEATLRCGADARGEVKVRILADNKELAEQTMAPRASHELKLDLAEAKELVIEVEFGKSILVPASVVLKDARIVKKA